MDFLPSYAIALVLILDNFYVIKDVNLYFNEKSPKLTVLQCVCNLVALMKGMKISLKEQKKTYRSSEQWSGFCIL